MGTESDNQEMMNWPDETIIETRVRYILDLNNRLFVFENVPARVNPVTGEQFFAPATVRRIQQIAQAENAPKRTIEANVYDWVNAA